MKTKIAKWFPFNSKTCNSSVLTCLPVSSLFYTVHFHSAARFISPEHFDHVITPCENIGWLPITYKESSKSFSSCSRRFDLAATKCYLLFSTTPLHTSSTPIKINQHSLGTPTPPHTVCPFYLESRFYLFFVPSSSASASTRPFPVHSSKPHSSLWALGHLPFVTT